MTIDLALNRLKELHDAIKEHPYWMNFEWLTFKNEVYPMYREVFELYSYLRFNKEYKNSESPWFATMSTIYHDFHAMLGILIYKPRIFETPIEDTDLFKQYYLPMLQNFLQILHFFVEGMNIPENMVMYMPDNVHNPKTMNKYMPVYHENWKDESGYKFWWGEYKWKAIKCVKKDNVNKTIEDFKKLINKTKSTSLKEFYKHAIMDLENDTSLCIKIEK
ncbi:hypothetical protein J6O48_03285 [bacterium]|nr:hypothetical protein [bacterium]